MDAFLSMIGDLAAGVAAVAALTGARYARQTVREARTERLEAEHVRLVRRLEWVGETIEHIDRLAEDDQHSRPVGETWRRGRHLLAQGFVGLDDQLPRTAELTHCADPYSARSIARLAREEVGSELQRLAREQARRQEERAHVDQARPGWAARLTSPRLPGRGTAVAPESAGRRTAVTPDSPGRRTAVMADNPGRRTEAPQDSGGHHRAASADTPSHHQHRLRRSNSG